MELREIVRKDISDETAFSPIREIILFDDDLWEEFENDNSKLALSSVEALFGINEIFPDGLSKPFGAELGKFMATLDTFQCTLSLMSSLASDENFLNIIHDYRMTIQNFQIFLELKSYYSAFIEFRKMLEGILWMKYMIENNEVPEKITTMDYQEKLRSINEKFGDAYAKLNSLFHYDENTPFIQINVVYGEGDHLLELLSCVDGIADDYESEISKFIEHFNNKSMKRYKVLLEKLYASRKRYNLTNHKISPSGAFIFNEGQASFEALIKKYSPYKYSDFKDKYEIGIKNISNTHIKIPNHTTMNISLEYLSRKYSEEFSKYKKMMNSADLSMMAQLSEIIRTSKRKNALFKKATTICTTLLMKEVKCGGDRLIAFMRSIFEDICFNAALEKNIGYAHTRLLSAIMKKEFDIMIKPMPSKFSHLLRDDRPVYKVNNASEEQLEKHQGYVKEFSLYLDNFSNEIKNIMVKKKTATSAVQND